MGFVTFVLTIYCQAFAASYTVISSSDASALGGATGGDIVRQIENADGSFDLIHIFNSSGSLSIPAKNKIIAGSLRALVVAGGGGGGFDCGAGGGAGGLVYKENLDAVAGDAAITVGTGGAGGSANTSAETRQGKVGNNSVFTIGTTAYTALGGGGGGGWFNPNGLAGGAGGSGGGSGGTAGGGTANQPTSASGGFGNVGGLGVGSNRGGGGGGAGTAGKNAANDKGGDGGDGLPYDISGETEIYAAGGGAARLDSSGGVSAEAGIGGSNGVGGNGQTSTAAPTSGRANSGSGGGGGKNSSVGAAGSAGVVIIRYTVPKPKESTVKPLVDAGLISFTGTTAEWADNGDLILQYKDATGSLTLPSYAQAWILSVGGGGAGGSAKDNATTYGSAGGGGGGQVNEQKDQLLTGGTYTITVGPGGVPSDAESGLPGGNGQPSKITFEGTELTAYTAVGGGGGGVKGEGIEGASGGGGSYSAAAKLGGKATAGYAGGVGAHNKAAGGGGGAGGVGLDTSANGKSGDGGDGAPIYIVCDEGDDPIYYAAGGGGGTITSASVGDGGKGGGGDGGGGSQGTGKSATPGTPNTGSGGGGGSHKQAGGAGGSGIVIIRISEALVGDPIKPATTNWVYTGEEQVLVPESLAYTVEGDGAGTDVGTYPVKVTLKPGFQWSDGTTDVVEFAWTISPKPIVKPTAPDDLAFNKGNQLALPTPDAALVFAEGSVTNATNAGSYSYTVTLKSNNYVWADAEAGHERDAVTVEWKIAAQRVTVPPVLTGLVYTGVDQDAVDMDLVDEEACVFSEEAGYTHVAQDAGDYTFRLVLNNTETEKNYVWFVDGEETYEDQERDWSIAPAPNAIVDLAIESWMKGNTPNVPTATVNFGSPVYTYAYAEDAPEEAWTNEVPTTAGTWWVRAQVAETANWAAAEAKQEFEIWGNPSELYEYSTTIAIDGYTATTALTDFQVPIRISETSIPGFYYDQLSDPQEIAFLIGDKILSYDLESWNPGGESIAWVRIPELAKDTSITMWWRSKPTKKPLANNPADVWPNYVGVWHMNDEHDATGNALMGTFASHATKTSGVIGGAYGSRLTGTNKPILTAAKNPALDSLNINEGFTVSMWVKLSTLETKWAYLFSRKDTDGGNSFGAQFCGGTQNATGGTAAQLAIHYNATDRNKKIDPGLTVDRWTRLDFGYTKSVLSIWIDGVCNGKKWTGTWAVGNLTNFDFGIGGLLNNGHGTFNGDIDEVRIRRGGPVGPDTGTVGSAQIKTEIAAGTNPGFTTPGPVWHGDKMVDAWLVKPTVDPLGWERTDDLSFLTITKGTLASGATVTNYFYYVNEPTNCFTEVSKLTKAGLARAVFVAVDDGTYEPITYAIDVRVFDRQDYADLGGSASGRVLLMNNDAGDAEHPAIDYQGWYDRISRSATLLSQATFWEYTGTNENDLVDDTYNRKGGTSWVLWTTNRERRLWSLEDCRHGNTFKNGDTTAAGSVPETLLSTQNYLPWSTTSRRINYHNNAATRAGEVGQLLMRNTTSAAVYSPLYTNGVGTIYFDAVNGWTVNATEDENNAYQIVVEVATETIYGDPLDETNSQREMPDGSIDPFGNAQWELATQYPVRVSASGELARPEPVLTNRLAVTTGGKMTEFYRVYVPVNTERARFRIRRVSTIKGESVSPDTAYILLDNILVSYPAMSADLKPTGIDTTDDPEKRGAFTFGQELATTVPFPSAGEKMAFGRAAVDYHLNDGVADPDTNAFVMAAKMHYRWRYLNQSFTPWQTCDLDVMNGFETTRPLELPDAVGDIEFWYDADIQAPFFQYVDYSGSGKGLPATVYTEEIPYVTNTYVTACRAAGVTPKNNLASGGQDWFFRLRNGASEWEGMKVRLEGGTKLDGDYAMELLGNDMWRALVKIPTNATGTCLFSFVGFNKVAAGATTLPGTAVSFGEANVATNTIPANGQLVEDGAKQRFEIDHNANYLEFKVSTKFMTWSLARAEYQNFNHWHDLVSPASAPSFAASYPTNGVDDVTMRTVVLNAGNWKLFDSANDNWNEPFYLADYQDPEFPKNEVFTEHRTPANWSAKNVSFVSTTLTSDSAADQKTKSGLAAKLLGQTKGTLEFTKANAPQGLDEVKVSARLGQSMTLDSISFNPAAFAKKNYTFVSPARMGTATPDDKDGDMTVGASSSVVAYYRPTRGCYEFRVERYVSGTKLRHTLYKWTFENGAATARKLAEYDFSGTKCRMWKNEANSKKFFAQLISVETSPDKKSTRIVCGLSYENSADIDSTASNLKALYGNGKINYYGLVYEDRNDPHVSGSYGVAAKDCPAVFMMPFHFDEPLSEAINIKGGATYGGSYFTDNNLFQLPAGNPVMEFFVNTSTGETCLPEDDWELVSGRCVGGTYSSAYPAWYVMQTPKGLTQNLDVYLQPKTGGAWTKRGTITVDSYAFKEKTCSLNLTGAWNLQLRTGRANTDVAVGSVKQTQWQAPDHERLAYIDNDFVYTQGLVETNKTLKLNTVKLQPSRGEADRPLSVRGPILNGLGKIAFSYTEGDPNAELWVQIATNSVTYSLTGDDGYNQSISSVEPPANEPLGSWVTVKKYAAGELNGAGEKTVYLGLHNQEDAPVTGLFRLFVPTNVVRQAIIVATNETARSLTYGQITLTSVTVTDEPGLSDRSWYGYNLRGIGDATDEEKRMYLTDTTLVGEDGNGLDVAINNSLKDVPAADVERARANLPSIVSPTFKGADSGVGAVTFKARLYSTNGIYESGSPGRVIIYGSSNSAVGEWVPVATNYVTKSVFQDFTWETKGENYAAIKIAIESPAVVSGNPALADCDRVIVDEVVVGERVQPKVSIVYAMPFRQNLISYEPIEDILSPNEQPLSGESWGVQTKLALEQLTDEIDTDRGFKVYLSYYTGPTWGYKKWRNEPTAVKLIPLQSVGEPSELIFRSVGETPESLVAPSAAGSSTVQFQVTVKYFDRQGAEFEKTLGEYKEWQQPDWFWPVDKNVENGGDKNADKFSPYTILDTVSPGRAWINEVNYNDGEEVGSPSYQTNQFIEVCVPSGIDLRGWELRATGIDFKEVTFARFGYDGVPSMKTTKHAVNGYEFLVLQSPTTEYAGGIRGPDGEEVGDGTWIRGGQPVLSSSGSFDYGSPYQIELVRPSGVIEHQFVLQGTNVWANYEGYGDDYEGTNFLKRLNERTLSPKRFYAGEDTRLKLDGTAYGSIGVVGGKADGNPPPGGEGTWKNRMAFTPGRLNEGQVIPEGWFLAPNGTNAWVTLRVDGTHLRQECGGVTDEIFRVVMPIGTTTNVTYTVPSWYELARLTADGGTVDGVGELEHKARFGQPFTCKISPTNQICTIVATEGYDSGLADFAGIDGPFGPSITRWLNEKWPDQTAENIRLGWWKEIGGKQLEKEMTLEEMYWLDVPPFNTANEEKVWWVRAGIVNLLPNAYTREIHYTDGSVQTLKDLRVDMKMYVSNRVDQTVYAPMRLQGMDYQKSDETTEAWRSETLQVTGNLLQLETRPENKGYLPFRSFVLNPDSFDPATYTAEIEIVDPFSTSSPGYGYGWSDWKSMTPVFRWRLTATNSVPDSVEMLRKVTTY